MIRLRDVSFSYPGGFTLRVPALDVAAGEVVAVVGPSGCGKSTLLHLVAGVLAADAGTIAVSGERLDRMSEDGRRAFRRQHVGLVPQALGLLESLTVRDNLLLPFRLGTPWPADADARATVVAERLGIRDLLPRSVNTLSAGERQRVAVGRALVARPPLVLADEPTGHLDPASTRAAMDALLTAARDTGATVLAITHDRGLLERFDRVIDCSTLRKVLPRDVPAAGPGAAPPAPTNRRGAVADVAFLAVRALRHHRGRTLVTAAALAVAFALPAALVTLARLAESRITARADATPLVIGPKGSPLELALAATHFHAPGPEPLPFAEVERLAATGLASPVPLYVGFRAGGDPLVGTTVDYFRLRGLHVADGRLPAQLGDCAIGAGVARLRNLHVSDAILTSTARGLDLAMSPPLRLRVVGVLAPADSPDDAAVFADLPTVWAVAGLLHAHGPADGLPVVNVTDANRHTFHAHGDPGTFPLTAIIADAPDAKSATRLVGRYHATGGTTQLVEPPRLARELIAAASGVRASAVAALAVAAGATLALFALVQALALQLRRGDLETLWLLGASPRRVAALVVTEAAGVVVLAFALAAGVTAIATMIAPVVIRRLLEP